ncbi:MAG TPA: ABC transporter substrate-binding protein [Chloroflexota bacterium]|nr:ABC transporter substrate-binding protein [Chloroflexota bacterium]
MGTGLRQIGYGVALAVLAVACAAPAASPAERAAVRPPAAGSAPPASGEAAPAPAAPAAPRELRHVRLGMSTYSAAYMDELVAMDKGYFDEEGLEIEPLIAGGGVLTPALVAGEIQFSTSASSALSAMIQGADLRVVYTSLDRPAYQLWSSTPDVRTLQDLVGRRVGISSRGDTHEISMRLLLKKHGIDPDSVVYAAVGSGAARISAIESGAVDAATLAPRDFLQLAQPRGNLLADIEEEIKLVYTGIATSGPLLRSEPGLVERFLRSVVKGREYARRYREETLAVLDKYTPTGRDVNEQDYDENVRIFTAEGWVPDEVIRDEVATRAQLIGATSPPAPSDLFDYSIVKKVYAELKARGWQPTP